MKKYLPTIKFIVVWTCILLILAIAINLLMHNIYIYLDDGNKISNGTGTKCFVIENGEYYHNVKTKNVKCKNLDGEKIEMTMNEAHNKGYLPCPDCWTTIVPQYIKVYKLHFEKVPFLLTLIVLTNMLAIGFMFYFVSQKRNKDRNN